MRYKTLRSEHLKEYLFADHASDVDLFPLHIDILDVVGVSGAADFLKGAHGLGYIDGKQLSAVLDLGRYVAEKRFDAVVDMDEPEREGERIHEAEVLVVVVLYVSREGRIGRISRVGGEESGDVDGKEGHGFDLLYCRSVLISAARPRETDA